MDVDQLPMLTAEDFRLARFPPYKHQVVGVSALVACPKVMLFDQMGLGKTKQIIDAAHILHARQEIDRVVVICPGSIRSVWFNQEFGELQKHRWESRSINVYQYRGTTRSWAVKVPNSNPLLWIITNYEFIRVKERLKEFLTYCGQKTLLVLDESSFIASFKSKQSKACRKIRQRCGRVVLLNGTPIGNSVGNLFNQAHTTDPAIFGLRSSYEFKARYAIMGGWQQKKVVKWRDIEEIQSKMAPYVLRRLSADCLDLPPKLPPVTLLAPLSTASWKIYKDLKMEMLAYLSEASVAMAQQAGARVLRLLQVCSGFLGGIKSLEDSEEDIVEVKEVLKKKKKEDTELASLQEGRPAWLPSGTVGTGMGRHKAAVDLTPDGPVGYPTLLPRPAMTPPSVEVIGREKLDFFMQWLGDSLEEDPEFKVVVFCRFRMEVATVFEEVRRKYPHVSMGLIQGSQTTDERNRALKLLKPGFAPEGPVVVVGITSAGGLGFDMTAANVIVYYGHDPSLRVRLQSMDRIHRPGQTRPVSYYNIVMTGPKGQRTVELNVLRALLRNEEVANWTLSAWIAALDEGDEQESDQ